MKASHVKMGERVVRCTRKITTNATASSDTMEHTAEQVNQFLITNYSRTSLKRTSLRPHFRGYLGEVYTYEEGGGDMQCLYVLKQR